MLRSSVPPASLLLSHSGSTAAAGGMQPPPGTTSHPGPCAPALSANWSESSHVISSFSPGLRAVSVASTVYLVARSVGTNTALMLLTLSGPTVTLSGPGSAASPWEATSADTSAADR